MNNIVLIGGGGHCKSVIDVIEHEGRFKIQGIVDKSEHLGTKILGYPIFGTDDDMSELASKYKNAIITVGQINSPKLRIRLFDLAIKSGFAMPKIISPNAYISKHSKVGRGVVVMHNAVINANASIGDNCIINSKALIEHDCKIFNHCHISTNVNLNGGTEVGSGSFVGSNATSRELAVIKENSFIKAGSIIK